MIGTEDKMIGGTERRMTVESRDGLKLLHSGKKLETAINSEPGLSRKSWTTT